MAFSVFKFVSIAKPQQFKKKVMGKRSTSRSELTLTFRQTTEQRRAKFCLLVLRCFFLGDVKFSPHHLTWLKISEIILTGYKTQIIIQTMATQLKVHINTTIVTKYDNNKYDKPEKL